MRVLVYTSIFPSSREPIRGIYCMYRVRALASYCDVQVVCPVTWTKRLTTPRQLFRQTTESPGGLKTYYPTFVSVTRFAPRKSASFMYHATRQTVSRVRQGFPFDAILALWGYPDAAAALRFARDYDVPLVTNLLGSDINVLAQKPEVRPLVAEALQASAGVVA